MNRREVLFAPAWAAIALAGCAISGRGPAATVVTPFSGAPPGELPRGWDPYVLRKDLPRTHYRTQVRDGKRVLHAATRGGSSGLRQVLHTEVLDARTLRWSWLLDTIPQEFGRDGEIDDAPARIVLGFDGDYGRLPSKDRALFEFVELITGHRLPYATLMYVWDARAPVGTVVPYRRTSRIRSMIVESGVGACGRWVHYQRDVAVDFLRVFGEPPGAINSVGILTDSDDTNVAVEAWYGDISLGA